MKAYKRLVIFAHFDRDNIIDDYVIHYLGELRQIAERLIVVTTSFLNDASIQSTKSIVDDLIIRENSGYDFCSWQKGIELAGDLSHYDEVVICNDSVYGPFFPLARTFERMERRRCDFWGMTESNEILHHIQSYFVVFKKRIISSREFKEFWEGINAEPSKQRVIEKYEIGMSQFLMKNGFSCQALFRQTGKMLLANWIETRPNFIDKGNIVASILSFGNRWMKHLVRLLSYYKLIDTSNHINPTHFFWKEMLTDGIPFVKISLLRGAEVSGNGIENIISAIAKIYPEYDLTIIRNNIVRRNAEK